MATEAALVPPLPSLIDAYAASLELGLTRTPRRVSGLWKAVTVS